MTPDTQGQDADRTVQGIVIILGSVMLMAFADAVVKLVSSDLTVWQIFAVRSAIGILLLGVFMRVRGIAFQVKAPGWVLLRGVLLVLTWLTFYASFPVLDLSVAAVAVYTNPIMITLLAALLIGERVTPRQWLGVGLGFLGVVAIIRPGTGEFSWFTILPLLAAAFYAMAMVLTRSKCRSETPIDLALSLHGVFLVTGLAATVVLAVIGPAADVKSASPFLLGNWAAMGPREWGLMTLLGVLSVVYFAGVARAYQVAAPQIIATFDYAYLVWAAIWGFVFFAEKPGLMTLCGMVLITLAGLLVAARSPRRMA